MVSFIEKKWKKIRISFDIKNYFESQNFEILRVHLLVRKSSKKISMPFLWFCQCELAWWNSYYRPLLRPPMFINFWKFFFLRVRNDELKIRFCADWKSYKTCFETRNLFSALNTKNVGTYPKLETGMVYWYSIVFTVYITRIRS